MKPSNHARTRPPGRGQERGVARPRGVLLVTAGICAVLIGSGAAFATYRLISKDQNTAATPSSRPPSSTPPSLAPAPDPLTPGPRGNERWQTVAEAYGRAFTNTSGGKQAWLSRLEQLVAPSLAQGYTYTDLAVVPDEDLLAATGGEPMPAPTPSREMQLEYTGGLFVDIVVSQDPSTKRWVVTTAVPAETIPAERV